jgi:hypothetical protein
MHTIRFGRRLRLPSTIAIKHQLRKAMAADQVNKAGTEAKSESTDISRMNVGPKRRSGTWVSYGTPEGSERDTTEVEWVPEARQGWPVIH